ncbi:MAG: PP2C family protein-serine/threonine phosphatase, partial [Planctomycetota bacterium]
GATGTIEELEPTGTALGILEEDRYRLKEVRPIGAGDLLLLYSDGLTEARNARRERFGVERLKDLLIGLRTGSAPEIVSGIAGAVTHFTGRGRPDDDCTLVAAKGTSSLHR